MSIFDNNLELTINTILVNEGIRPAMLIQDGDFDEKFSIEEAAEAIREKFPELIASNNYSRYEGVILSKTNYNGRHDISREKMGEILGYPCYKGWNVSYGYENITYVMDINVYLKGDPFPYQLFANVCKDESSETTEKFIAIANAASRVIFSDKYKDLLTNFEIDSIRVDKREDLSHKDKVLNKLATQQPLGTFEKNVIAHLVYQFKDVVNTLPYKEFFDTFVTTVDYDNPNNRAIISELLLLPDKNYNVDPYLQKLIRLKKGGNKKTKSRQKHTRQKYSRQKHTRQKHTRQKHTRQKYSRQNKSKKLHRKRGKM